MRDHVLAKGLQRGELGPRRPEPISRRCAITKRSVSSRRLRERPAATETTGAAHEQRLRFVLRARELRVLASREVRALLRLVDERDQPCAEASRLAAIHLSDVRAKIADLRRMERVLKDVVR